MSRKIGSSLTASRAPSADRSPGKSRALRDRGRRAPRCGRRETRSDTRPPPQGPSPRSARRYSTDVGFEPRILRTTAAALKDQRPIVRLPRRAATRRADSVSCALISRGARHRDRNAVRGEHEARPALQRGRQRLERRPHVRGVRLDEPFVGVPVARRRRRRYPEDPRRRSPCARRRRSAGTACSSNTSGAPRRRIRSPAARRPRHPTQRVRQQRMPVAHAEIDGHVDAARRESRPQSVDLPPRDGGQRRDAAEDARSGVRLPRPVREIRAGLAARWRETGGRRRAHSGRRTPRRARRRTAGESPRRSRLPTTPQHHDTGKSAAARRDDRTSRRFAYESNSSPQSGLSRPTASPPSASSTAHIADDDRVTR